MSLQGSENARSERLISPTNSDYNDLITKKMVVFHVVLNSIRCLFKESGNAYEVTLPLRGSTHFLALLLAYTNQPHVSIRFCIVIFPAFVFTFNPV
ncbi:MAG TPA: hypothetical protein VJM50_04220 [Pyrinomonadaceae bacterium]|nr:hypothetical protein [Pyrinomonadaceae bacterium]